VVVTDTGVGIPNSIKPKLFNLYATFDYGNGTNRHGIGLGLVICKKLVGLLGPTPEIQIESQVGVGTKFTFYLNINNEGKTEHEPKYLQNNPLEE
jgi:signal transduction histidine kinase